MNTNALALRKAEALAHKTADALARQSADAPVEQNNDAPAGQNNDAPARREAHLDTGIHERDLQAQERFEDELIMHLERDQFVVETSRPVPRATLSARVTVGLWALRVFVVLLSLMVVYAFIDQLH
jgi:hypothetical protein